MDFEYPAIRFSQIDDNKIILFSSPVHEIIEWGGIPRKEQRSDVETIGFQRESNSKRIKEIGEFLNNRSNVIANPVLGVARNSEMFEFSCHEKFNDQVELGVLKVSTPDFNNMDMKKLLKEVMNILEERKSELKDIDVEEREVDQLLSEIGVQEYFEEDELDEEDEDMEQADTDQPLVIESESHIDDFYRALKLRLLAVERTGDDPEEIANFHKDFMKDILKPIMIVDGQHRILGANREIVDQLNDEEEIDKLMSNGLTRQESKDEIHKKHSRRFGFSLIENADWSEHVFQFVVVNQKATPISKPLLASIIATTLTDDEISRITERLTNAGIEVTDYIVIDFIRKDRSSPFYDLVKRGFSEAGDANKLDMSQADKLIKIFRYLKGGRLYHDRKVDFAKNWGDVRITQCDFLKKYKQKGFKSAREYWSDENGPWRDVFLKFWTTVKELMSSDDEHAWNYWGRPKQSNLFNGVHLTILTADFFSFLYERNPKINKVEEIEEIVKSQWLEFVNTKCKAYFDRDWNLAGLRKTDKPVRDRWSELWTSFRKNASGKLPSVKQFRP